VRTGVGGPAAGRRLVVAAVLLLVPIGAAACGRASADDRSHLTVRVTIHHSTFDPPAFEFRRGTAVTFVIRNTDPIEHEFIVGDQAVQYYIEHTKHPTHTGSVPGQISIPAGETRTTTYTFTAVTHRASDMTFACHVPGHFRYGMHGPITVTA